MNIDNNTLFFGENLGSKLNEFKHNINTLKYCKHETIYFNEKKQHWSEKFIVKFEDQTECLGIAIIEKNWCKVIYITDFNEQEDNFEL